MWELGDGVRALLDQRGFKSVAAAECAAPTVVVAYHRDANDSDMLAKFKAEGIQLAGGVPLKIDEPWESFGAPPTFRIGLFGLDKLCLLYTSDAADDLLCVDLGGRRIIKKQIQARHNNEL
eukprot:TRINITY_DN7211_c0_g1_i1.p1 TRINITY_DN7211_c0_g1~~TRINITY_DN7211_c0_g1_i1.p1  ORF type:complete len:121 (+),score=46.00 TRINITY_DN7211_c0_g1_i1:134-496(+)